MMPGHLFSIPIKIVFASIFFFTFSFNYIQAQGESPEKIDSSGVQKAEEIFVICEEMPRFPGCENVQAKMDKAVCAYKKMMQYINGLLKYPEDAKNNLIEGKVIVRFVISKEGIIKNPAIIEDIGYGCGKEVIRVIETMNSMPQKWIPGKQGGKNVNVSFNIPVEFRMTDRLKSKIRQQNPPDIDLSKESVFTEPEVMPRFPGCESIESEIEKQNCATIRLIDYIQAKLIFPEEAKSRDIDGKVVVRFIVRKDGYISNCEIIEDLEGGFGADIKRVVDDMNKRNIKWVPGMHEGSVVNVSLTVPVYFRRKATIPEK